MGHRIHSGWILALVLLTLSLPMAGLAFSIRGIADRRWSDLEQQTKMRAADLRGRDPHRPVLRGTPEAGKAWDVYTKAEKIVADPGSYAIVEFMEGRGDLRREQIQALLERYRPALDLIQCGTRRTDLSRALSWEEKDFVHVNPWRLRYVGACRARFLAEEGRAGEAVTLLLDLLQYCTDAGRLGTWWDNYLGQHQVLLTDLKSLMSAGLLDREQMRQVARELRMIDDQIPGFGEGMLNDAMQRGFGVLRVRTVEAFLAEREIRDKKILTWSSGFSEQLMLAKYGEIQFQVATRIAEGDSKPWKEAKRLTADASAELGRTSNPLVKLDWDARTTPDWVPMLRDFLERRAQLRLLRAAASYRADGAVPDVDDPFGDKLKWVRTRNGLKIWSVGGDGVDDGGSGDWKPRFGRDIVIVAGP